MIFATSGKETMLSQLLIPARIFLKSTGDLIGK